MCKLVRMYARYYVCISEHKLLYTCLLRKFGFIIRCIYSRSPSIISSPEHEVLMVSYCDQSLSVVRRASSTICFKS